MRFVKTRLSRLSAMETVSLGRNVVTNMTANANFLAPTPSLAAITSGMDDIEAAIAAVASARTAALLATQVLRDKLRAGRALLAQESAYVQTASNGDAAKIESSGFDVKSAGGRVGPLAAPAGLVLDTNLNPGSMGLRWPPVRGAVSYVVERAEDGPAPRQFVGVATTTVSKANVNSMTSGARYWFRVAAVNAAGTGLYTAEVSKIAP